MVVVKRHFNAFATPSAQLHELLRKRGVSHLLCCGLLTSVCVHHTALGAQQRAYAVSVIADACADLSRRRHDAVLELYGDKYIYDVLSAQQAVAAIRGDRGRGAVPPIANPAPAPDESRPEEGGRESANQDEDRYKEFA